jgi:Ca2+-binding RTX toxin-like protein
MIRTIDFNSFRAGTVIDDEYADIGLHISAMGGSNQAMIFDSANPTGGDDDLASQHLQGLLIISEDGDSSDPDDNAGGGSICLEFDDPVFFKTLTFKDIEETGNGATSVVFYDANDNVIEERHVEPTGDGGERTVGFFVADVAKCEVRFAGSGGIDNVTYRDDRDDNGNLPPDARDDEFEIDEDTTIEFFPLTNDSDPDGDTLTITGVTTTNGTVSTNGTSVTFTPAPDYNGPATLTYTVSDGRGGTDQADIYVTVRPVDDGGPDGYVDGDDTGNLIDEDYTGDPNGDFIDNDDALLPGTEGDDDYVRAGGGDDTVIADDGSDTVEGGDGDDLIETGNGDVAPDLGYPFSDADSLGYAPDSDPENDRDLVDGGDGNDTISTGDDRDTIFGGDGDDVIDGGIDDDVIQGNGDDDRIVGGEGNDDILGGSGNDTIYAGNDPELGLDVLDIPDEETPGFGFSPDRQPLNGRDTVDGGGGDDVIYGADDDDLLMGGSGNDFIDGQIDDDTIDGNTGDDTLYGGQGDDSVEGGQGADMLDGGEGDDTLRGNRGEDVLVGGDGNDSMDGGGENDVLSGGDGDDSMTGNQGNDTLMGGAGADTMSGGAGEDVFEDVNAGDQIDGGSGPVDFDTLFLAGSAPEGGRFEITYTSDDREDGFVSYFNEDGSDAGRLDFVEIENVVPCFTPGTLIATPQGERRVEDLKVGDRVITRDNGMQEIRWVGAREMSGAEFEKAPHLKPILIRQGALGRGLPERDMMVSPQHRVLIASDKTALYFEEREVLVAAKHLTDREGIDPVEVSGTTYIHLMFDQHEVILSDGAWTESFQPGDMTLGAMGDAQRQEILELFPELATREGLESYGAARRSLKRYEAKLLAE